MLKYKCCFECYSKIKEKSNEIANLWTELCKQTILRDSDYLGLKKDHKIEWELKQLEKLCFISSHETGEGEIIRIEGHIIDAEDTDAFCINIEKHGIDA